MNHKQAAKVLIKLLGKKQLNAEEKAALQIAIGVLAWTSLAQSRIKNLRAKHKKI